MDESLKTFDARYGTQADFWQLTRPVALDMMFGKR